jgi:hypothetical protein
MIDAAFAASLLSLMLVKLSDYLGLIGVVGKPFCYSFA